MPGRHFVFKAPAADDGLSVHKCECCRPGFQTRKCKRKVDILQMLSSIMASTPPFIKKGSGWCAQLYLNGQCKYWASDKWIPLFSIDYHIHIPCSMRKVSLLVGRAEQQLISWVCSMPYLKRGGGRRLTGFFFFFYNCSTWGRKSRVWNSCKIKKLKSQNNVVVFSDG